MEDSLYSLPGWNINGSKNNFLIMHTKDMMSKKYISLGFIHLLDGAGPQYSQ